MHHTFSMKSTSCQKIQRAHILVSSYLIYQIIVQICFMLYLKHIEKVGLLFSSNMSNELQGVISMKNHFNHKAVISTAYQISAI